MKRRRAGWDLHGGLPSRQHKDTPVSDDIVYYSAEHGILNPTPEGYEPAAVSAAKNVVLCELECLYDIFSDFLYDEEEDVLDTIGLADKIVEALLKAGIAIPEDIKDPCR